MVWMQWTTGRVFGIGSSLSLSLLLIPIWRQSCFWVSIDSEITFQMIVKLFSIHELCLSIDRLLGIEDEWHSKRTQRGKSNRNVIVEQRAKRLSPQSVGPVSHQSSLCESPLEPNGFGFQSEGLRQYVSGSDPSCWLYGPLFREMLLLGTQSTLPERKRSVLLIVETNVHRWTHSGKSEYLT